MNQTMTTVTLLPVMTTVTHWQNQPQMTWIIMTQMMMTWMMIVTMTRITLQLWTQWLQLLLHQQIRG